LGGDEPPTYSAAVIVSLFSIGLIAQPLKRTGLPKDIKGLAIYPAIENGGFMA